jgi:hypothetical protein
MFIETYYDDRAAVPGSTSEPVVPYPELSGGELTLWPVAEETDKISLFTAQ